MGYDMFIQGAPKAIQGAAEEEPDTAPGSAIAPLDDPDYLRRNIFGMGPVRGALAQLGMAFDSVPPNFPDSSHLSREKDFGDDGEPSTEQAKTYVEAIERTLADHGAGDAEYLA